MARKCLKRTETLHLYIGILCGLRPKLGSQLVMLRGWAQGWGCRRPIFRTFAVFFHSPFVGRLHGDLLLLSASFYGISNSCSLFSNKAKDTGKSDYICYCTYFMCYVFKMKVPVQEHCWTWTVKNSSILHSTGPGPGKSCVKSHGRELLTSKKRIACIRKLKKICIRKLSLNKKLICS
jgi:hypothetical protein